MNINTSLRDFKKKHQNKKMNELKLEIQDRKKKRLFKYWEKLDMISEALI